MPHVLAISGSLRAASSATAVMEALIGLIGDRATVARADIGAVPHYNADHDGGAGAKAFIAAVGAAQGVLIVTPEYNYSIPGVLKNAIDWASRPGYNSVFKGKPVFLVTTSAGALGGVRAQGAVKQVMTAVLAEVHQCPEVVVPQAVAKTVEGRFADQATLDFAAPHLAAWLAKLG
jgi:chromate reductase